MTPEVKLFIETVNEGRALHVRMKNFDLERSDYFANVRKRGIDPHIVKEVIRRYESKDPLSFSEFDEKLNQAIETYSKFSPKEELAQDLLRVGASAPAHTRERAHVGASAHAQARETETEIASTISPSPQIRGNGSQATAADSATDLPGDLSAATISDTAAEPGETPAAVSAPSTKADDAVVVRTLAPVFARYKNGAHA